MRAPPAVLARDLDSPPCGAELDGLVVATVWMHKDVLPVAFLRTSHLSSSVLFCTISSKRRRRRHTSPTMASSNLVAETAQMHAFSSSSSGETRWTMLNAHATTDPQYVSLSSHSPFAAAIASELPLPAAAPADCRPCRSSSLLACHPIRHPRFAPCCSLSALAAPSSLLPTHCRGLVDSPSQARCSTACRLWSMQ
ncbi:hypothetical protein GUJ93_ZPchr0458g22267 [Zizania palustris]|uniref:Uncharacterized protein n=1 Tax=Zizania palustris TaxID=103762 RepID=A0A8J5RCJ8_ZIZPA|nr:hypothetical protein GUJ93_ZPchr0458g22267 [Zizania palustris]